MFSIGYDLRCISSHRCDAQLFRPTTSSCGSTPWSDPDPTYAQGPGAPRVGVDPIPPIHHGTSRVHIAPVNRCNSSGETRTRGVCRPAIGRTPLVHADHLLDDWRPYGQSRRGSGPPGQPRGVTRWGLPPPACAGSVPPPLHDLDDPCA
jgi:hypothetical protein